MIPRAFNSLSLLHSLLKRFNAIPIINVLDPGTSYFNRPFVCAEALCRLLPNLPRKYP